jgi:glucan phosphoethanolaminetransferase (alkaline phosphatase superfamily)
VPKRDKYQTGEVYAMGSILTQKWLWMIIFSLILIVVFPFLLVLLILSLPPPYNAVATVLLVIGWGVAAGYKDWIMSKEGEKEQAEK